jgi:hypothetical protein
LQNNDNRWYNAIIGRWLSQDPLGLGPDTNPYRYCGNGPTNGTDPSGLAFQVQGDVAHVSVAVDIYDPTTGDLIGKLNASFGPTGFDTGQQFDGGSINMVPGAPGILLIDFIAGPGVVGGRVLNGSKDADKRVLHEILALIGKDEAWLFAQINGQKHWIPKDPPATDPESDFGQYSLSGDSTCAGWTDYLLKIYDPEWHDAFLYNTPAGLLKRLDEFLKGKERMSLPADSTPIAGPLPDGDGGERMALPADSAPIAGPLPDGDDNGGGGFGGGGGSFGP